MDAIGVRGSYAAGESVSVYNASPFPCDEVYSVIFAVSTRAPLSDCENVSTHEPNCECTFGFCVAVDYLLVLEGKRATQVAGCDDG